MAGVEHHYVNDAKVSQIFVSNFIVACMHTASVHAYLVAGLWHRQGSSSGGNHKTSMCCPHCNGIRAQKNFLLLGKQMLQNFYLLFFLLLNILAIN